MEFCSAISKSIILVNVGYNIIIFNKVNKAVNISRFVNSNFILF